MIDEVRSALAGTRWLPLLVQVVGALVAGVFGLGLIALTAYTVWYNANEIALVWAVAMVVGLPVVPFGFGLFALGRRLEDRAPGRQPVWRLVVGWLLLAACAAIGVSYVGFLISSVSDWSEGGSLMDGLAAVAQLHATIAPIVLLYCVLGVLLGIAVVRVK